jgi:hypothetical protein
VNAAKGKRTEIRSQEVVGAASCREGRKGEEQVSRGDAANATEGENQGECVALSRKRTGFQVYPAQPESIRFSLRSPRRRVRHRFCSWFIPAKRDNTVFFFASWRLRARNSFQLLALAPPGAAGKTA